MAYSLLSNYGYLPRSWSLDFPRNTRAAYACCLCRTFEDYCCFLAKFSRSIHGCRHSRFICGAHSTPALKQYRTTRLRAGGFYTIYRVKLLKVKWILLLLKFQYKRKMVRDLDRRYLKIFYLYLARYKNVIGIQLFMFTRISLPRKTIACSRYCELLS